MTREQLMKDILEEIIYIKTSKILTKKDSEAIVDLIVRQHKYINELCAIISDLEQCKISMYKEIINKDK